MSKHKYQKWSFAKPESRNSDPIRTAKYGRLDRIETDWASEICVLESCRKMTDTEIILKWQNLGHDLSDYMSQHFMHDLIKFNKTLPSRAIQTELRKRFYDALRNQRIVTFRKNCEKARARLMDEIGERLFPAVANGDTVLLSNLVEAVGFLKNMGGLTKDPKWADPIAQRIVQFTTTSPSTRITIESMMKECFASRKTITHRFRALGIRVQSGRPKTR